MNRQSHINWTGWGVFSIALLVYLLTMAPTASFWDCGEFIACANELEVSHPPGAPFFILLGRLFAMSTGDVSQIAFRVNLLSVLAGAFTALFTCWIAMILANRGMEKASFSEEEKKWGSVSAGLVAGLACIFADSLWWNAVEAEVYSLSSFFTAIVVWLMLKWQARAHETDHLKWIILIVYLMGLSIGVHLLNLLTIPALSLIFYFRMFSFSWKGFLLTLLFSLSALLLIQYGIIQYTFQLAWLFEKWMTGTISADGNTMTGLGFPQGTGAALLAFIILSILIGLLVYSHRAGKVVLNTVLLCVAVIYIGFSSYTVIFLRSQADTPIDMNNPEDIHHFLSYMQREQYGDRPLLYGPMYSGQVVGIEEGEMRYMQLEGQERYVEDVNRNEYLYRPEDYVLFPRMYEVNRYAVGPYGYVNYVADKGEDPNYPLDDSPTRWEDFVFFLDYQLGHMYFRYFLWNFAGRSSDLQDDTWESGFEPASHLAWQKDNKAKNHFYFLPLLLGMMGLVWQLIHHKRDALVLGVLFLLTGVAIIVYLNQYPAQPRERDYSFAGSFQTFCVWIGLGSLFLMDWMRGLGGKIGRYMAIGLSLVPPLLMGYQGWDDHDRGSRYIDRDFAYNLLNSCAPNAILFTGGDNDTFSLWYIQEVEGVRTDVRVVNLELLISDWYVNQLRQTQNGAPPVPISIPEEEYRGEGGLVIRNASPMKLSIPLDPQKLIEHKILSRLESQWTPDTLVLNFPTRGSRDNPYLLRKDLVLVDIVSQVAKGNWERPIYFASMMSPESYLGLEDYFRLEGMAYRLVPVPRSTDTSNDLYLGWIGQEILHKNLTETFLYRGLDKNTYLDEHIRQVILGGSYFNTFFRLGLSYGDEIQALKGQQTLYDFVVNNPDTWLDSLQRFEDRPLAMDEINEPNSDRIRKLQDQTAKILLNKPDIPSQAIRDSSETYAKKIQGQQEKVKELLNFMFAHIPQDQVPYSYNEWAMLVEIYEKAELKEDLLMSVDQLVEKGLEELALIQQSGRQISPQEMAFSAVLMGMQYYQELGEMEKVQELTERMEVYLGGE